MTGPVLKVDPAVLQKVSTAFGQAGDQLADLRAEEPLSNAATAVPQLETAAACLNAHAKIAAEMTTLADSARRYAGNLGIAARQYQAGDQSAASKIGSINFPS